MYSQRSFSLSENQTLHENTPQTPSDVKTAEDTLHSAHNHHPRRLLRCSPRWPQHRISILAITGSSMVISFLNLMANRKAETVRACLHFSCYMMVAWCLHEHVAMLRDLFPPVQESVMHFFLSTSWSSRPHDVTKHYGNVNLCIPNKSCFQRYHNCSTVLESSRP